MKTNGEMKTVQDIQKSIVNVHSLLIMVNHVKEFGVVMISMLSPLIA